MTRAFTVALAAALIVVTVWWQLAEKRARGEHARAVAAEAAAAAAARAPHVGPDTLAHGAAATVLADLARHPELIPYPSVEGGTMRFWPGQSRVLPPKWVYAYFEDGHMAGHALLEYTRRPDGTLAWKRIASVEE